MKVFLTGFMGAGKSAVGRRLAERLALPFVDLDARIETRAGRSIVEIFAAGGEGEFRRLEREALAELLAVPGEAVVAVGGGTFVDAGNLERARRAGPVVWVNPPFAEIVRRIGARGKADRPLFASEAQAFDLYRERLASYRLADLTLEVPAGESADESAARLALRLAELRCST